jgi:two-component system sensor histidine kinase MtrB
MRNRIRLAVVIIAAASAAFVSVVAYVTTRARQPGGPEADGGAGLLAIGLALVAACILVAVGSSVAGTRIANAIAGSLGELSATAREIADRVDPEGRDQADPDEVGAIASSFERVASGVERRLLRERAFVATVSHELRTPLTALQTAAEILASKRGALPVDAAEAADLVVDRSRRMARLVIELMEITELESGKAPVRWEPVDLRALLVTLLARRGRTVPVDGGGVITYADKARLERVMGNLVDNAYEHADGRGVEVSIRTDGHEVVLAVADRGPGLSPDDIPHLFESFFKSGRSRARRRGGIGLGLPIAYENARLLEGTIGVESILGRGTTFSLRLPLRSTAPAGGQTTDEL